MDEDTNTPTPGDYIDQQNVAGFDTEPTTERYNAVNTSSRHPQTDLEGYLLKDTKTGQLHVANLDTIFADSNYEIRAVNVILTVNSRDYTAAIINDLGRGVQYDHSISQDNVRIEYADGESSWPAEVGDENWDVIATVKPK